MPVLTSFLSLTVLSLLKGIIGTPDPRVLSGVEDEHCSKADSLTPFTTSNYSVTTTSQLEFWFVVNPQLGLQITGREGYPAERQSTLAQGALARRPLPPSAFQERLDAFNSRLAAVGQPTVETVEMMAARLYTGPMFEKYAHKAMPHTTLACLTRHLTAASSGG